MTHDATIAPPTNAELMITTAAAALFDGAVCFVGIGLPSIAANLARQTHAPDLVLVYESGTLGSRPTHLPLSIGDGELAETADVVVSVPELFDYWLQPGRIDVGFLGAAQIDRFGNINTTVLGDYEKPNVRLPGAGGAPAIADYCHEVFVMLPHTRRHLVAELDFVTTYGHGNGTTDRSSLGLSGRGPCLVVTDLGILKPDPVSHELALVQVHPGVTVDDVREATGWDLLVSPKLDTTSAPDPQRIHLLRTMTAPGGTA